MRATVLEPAPRRIFAPALGFTALAAIAVALFGYFLWPRTAAEPAIRALPTVTRGVETNVTAPATASPSTPIAGVAVDAPQSPQHPTPVPTVASRRRVSPAVRVAAVDVALPSDRDSTADSSTLAAAPPPSLFIEIHTADPDVRILWIADQAPAESNPTSVMED